jgi:uncharacterized protein
MRMNRHRRTWLAAGAPTALTAHMLSNVYRFEVTRLRKPLLSLREPVRVAFLCDFHYGVYVRRASIAAWVDATRSQDPDLVLIGGDLVDGLVAADIEPLTGELARLQAPLGVYATWGNHDYIRFDDLTPFGEALEASGVTVLRNRGVRVRHDLFIAGIDDWGEGMPDVAAALRERPDAAACLLVSHDPRALSEIPPEVELTLCGHTHGGQVHVPGVGAIVKASRYAQRFARGWTRRSGLGYVSRGLGVGVVPFRLNCPPELTILDLTP